MGKGPRRVPEDRAATLEEVEEAIRNLSDVDYLRLRNYARLRVAGLASRDRSAEDLIATALMAALEGGRRWPPAQVDFVGFLLGAIRSISNHWYEKMGIGRGVVGEASMRHESDEGAEMSPLDKVASHASSAEDQLIEREETAEAKRRVEQVTDLLAGDKVALEILDAMVGMSREDVRVAMDLAPNEWEAAWKRIRRKALGVAMGGASDA